MTKHVYGYDKTLKRTVYISLGIILLVFLLSKVWTIFIIVCLLSVYKILDIQKRKLIITEDGINLVSGIIFKKNEEIQFKKINNIVVKEIFGIGSLRIYTGNDKPIKFMYLDNYLNAKETISKKIK